MERGQLACGTFRPIGEFTRASCAPCATVSRHSATDTKETLIDAEGHGSAGGDVLSFTLSMHSTTWTMK